MKITFCPWSTKIFLCSGKYDLMTKAKVVISYIFFTDPDTDWPQAYPMCGGENQSPINIDSDNATVADYSSLSFSIGYKFVQKGPLENNGHTRMAFSYFSTSL